MAVIRFLASCIVVCLSACGGGGGSGVASSGTGSGLLPNPLPSTPLEPASPRFANAATASNIDYVVAYTVPLGGDPVAESTFGGAAAGDCDADGDIDLFITYGDGGPNRLYINQLNRGSGVPLQFQDTAALAGVANTRSDGQGNDRHSGPTFADMDGDGDLDLFVGGIFTDPNKLYRNRGDCTFEDVTAGSGFDNLFTHHTISAAFGDYDLDGRVDLFLTHWDSDDGFPAGGESEHLFRNVSGDGVMRFDNVSAATRVTEALTNIRAYATSDRSADFSFTPTFARINDDLWPDIVIAGDYGTSQLLLNSGAPGNFIDATSDAVHSVEYGMGSALGDYDFDGDLDWFITAFYGFRADGDFRDGNRLLQNPGGDFSIDRFADVTDEAGVVDGRWGWGACFLDIDNDADLDIYQTNGWDPTTFRSERSHDRSVAFVFDGAGGFSEQAAGLGLDDDYNGRGVVCADFDNDGDIDILQLTNEPGNSAALWENVSAAAGNNFLRVQLIGLPPNTEAAGARIFLRIGPRTQMREITIGSNYTSQNPTVQVFGLGTATSVDELWVEWPALVPDGTSDPIQPARTDVALPVVNARIGVAGTTLIVCHPELLPAPQECDA